MKFMNGQNSLDNTANSYWGKPDLYNLLVTIIIFQLIGPLFKKIYAKENETNHRVINFKKTSETNS